MRIGLSFAQVKFLNVYSEDVKKGEIIELQQTHWRFNNDPNVPSSYVMYCSSVNDLQGLSNVGRAAHVF
jgi:hypothetical protein